jgi:hypothetical protein
MEITFIFQENHALPQLKMSEKCAQRNNCASEKKNGWTHSDRPEKGKNLWDKLSHRMGQSHTLPAI